MNSTNDDLDSMSENTDDTDFKVELRACQCFLVDSEMEEGRQRVMDFVMSTLKNVLGNKKLDRFSKDFNYTSRVNLAFGFVMKRLEDRCSRYFYAQ